MRFIVAKSSSSTLIERTSDALLDLTLLAGHQVNSAWIVGVEV